jgi:hypothetical protein
LGADPVAGLVRLRELLANALMENGRAGASHPS